MNRNVKNVVMILIILIVCVCSYFTMTGAVKSSMPSNDTFKNGERPNKEELPENFEKREMPNIDELPENFEGNFKNGNFSREEFKPSISVIYYILFAVEGLIISSLLIYLIMSKFNSKTLKETLGTGNKIIIFIILSIIITIGLTVTQSMLAKNIFATNDMPKIENRQRPENNNNNLNNTNETNEVENV